MQVRCATLLLDAVARQSEKEATSERAVQPQLGALFRSNRSAVTMSHASKFCNDYGQSFVDYKIVMGVWSS